MRTRRSPRNQEILWRALGGQKEATRPVDKVALAEKALADPFLSPRMGFARLWAFGLRLQVFVWPLQVFCCTPRLLLRSGPSTAHYYGSHHGQHPQRADHEEV